MSGDDTHGLDTMNTRIAQLEGRVEVLSDRTAELVGRQAQAVEDRADTDALRRAARVLRRRSRKPRGILLTAISRILTDLADTIDEELEDTQ